MDTLDTSRIDTAVDSNGETEKQKKQLFLGFYNYTVILTYMAIPAVVLGITAAFFNHFYTALVCIMFAGLCDAFDGKVARTRSKSTEEERSFGIQIDSLVDLVCYGVTPAVMGFALLIQHYNIEKITVRFIISALVFAFYILAAIIRLAYYNVTEETRQKTEKGNRKYFCGMPVTTAALLIPAIFIFYNTFSKQTFTTVYTVCLAVIAILFISNFKLRKPGIRGLIIMVILGAGVLAALLITATM